MLSVAELKKIEDLRKKGLTGDKKFFLEIIDNLRQEQNDDKEEQEAIFNILEDINDAQEKLNKKYIELNAIKSLIQNLGKSLESQIIIDNLVKNLKKILARKVNFVYFVYLPYSKKFSNYNFVDSSETLSDKYLQIVNKDLRLKLLNLDLNNKQEILDWFKRDFHYKFINGKKDKGGQDKPLSLFSLPLVVNNKLLGAISLSSKIGGYFNEEKIDLIKTSFEITKSTISRLQGLLDSEESRIESLVRNLSNGVVMFGLDLKVTMINQAGINIFGKHSSDFYIFDIIKVFEIENKKITRDILKMLKSGESFFYSQIKSSRFVYELTFTPVRDNRNTIIGGALLLHDITHFIEIDRMKSEFVSLASHQLRTPLTAIKLFIEMIASQDIGKLNTKQKEYIENVQKSTQHMITLVKSLLDVSRIETGQLKIKLKPTQYEDFIQEIIEEANPLIENKNIKIIFKKPRKKLAKIMIDPILIQQVIHNLITNAIKYSNKQKSDIIIKLKAVKESYLFSITDQGIGIPKKSQEKIFKKFFRAKNASKKDTNGIGLGLYIAHMIVQASGGKLWFKSEEGKGTSFFLSLPKKGVKAKQSDKNLIVSI